MSDVFGRALLDYQSGNYTGDILTESSIGGADSLSLPYLFRNYTDMPKLEQKAMDLSLGNILDIGCGAGNHALYLQEKGLVVTGLDISPGAIETCKLRGLKKTVNGTIYDIDGMNFDTLLLLMNGIGLAGSMSELDYFLTQLRKLLNPGGQILVDSSDIIYMYDLKNAKNDPGDHKDWASKGEDYYGEVTFTMEYKEIKSSIFKWLYIDYNTLKEAAANNGLLCEIVMEGDHYDYLARLSIIK